MVALLINVKGAVYLAMNSKIKLNLNVKCSTLLNDLLTESFAYFGETETQVERVNSWT